LFKIIFVIVVGVWVVFFGGWNTIKNTISTDSCLDYSELTCDQLEAATYNVFFYYPNDKEKYLGVSYGLDECGDVAHYHARKVNNPSGWGYVCCLQTEDSECAEKHR
jgi:uncharacterized protein YbdZ (MbtH family)